jgi:hypothetical protein
MLSRLNICFSSHQNIITRARSKFEFRVVISKIREPKSEGWLLAEWDDGKSGNS